MNQIAGRNVCLDERRIHKCCKGVCNPLKIISLKKMGLSYSLFSSSSCMYLLACAFRPLSESIGISVSLLAITKKCIWKIVNLSTYNTTQTYTSLNYICCKAPHRSILFSIQVLFHPSTNPMSVKKKDKWQM